jgi:hypothetical protein
MIRPEWIKKPRIRNIQLEWKINTVILTSNGMEFVSWAAADVCFKIQQMKGILKQMTVLLTKIIFLLVNMRRMRLVTWSVKLASQFII